MIKLQLEGKKPEFKKELSYIELRGVKEYLKDYFLENYNIYDIEDKFGLPYTSSGQFAELSNTNCQFEIEKGVNLRYIAVTNNNVITATGWDEEENEYFYKIV